MAKQSAGILVYRRKNSSIEVFLVHPGGPFWAKKDEYSWSIPKGEYQENESPFEVAKHEFKEETGKHAPNGEYQELGDVKLASGKTVKAWSIEKDIGEIEVKSNMFELEWPPKSGQMQQFLEVDKAAWFVINTASRKIHPGLNEFLKRLAEKLGIDFDDKSHGELEDKLNDKQVSLL